jgi:hypothetical protein
MALGVGVPVGVVFGAVLTRSLAAPESHGLVTPSNSEAADRRHRCDELVSWSNTTSDSMCSRWTARILPSGERAYHLNWSAAKWVIWRPPMSRPELSRGWSQRFSTPFSRTGYMTAFPSGVNIGKSEMRGLGSRNRRGGSVPASRVISAIFCSVTPGFGVIVARYARVLPSPDSYNASAPLIVPGIAVPGTTSGLPPSNGAR